MSDADGLGPLPKLKAFTLAGPATFTLQPLVRVHIQDTRDTMGSDWSGLCTRFSEWAYKNRILYVKGESSGGGAFTAYYLPADAERIRAWLAEQGGQEAPTV